MRSFELYGRNRTFVKVDKGTTNRTDQVVRYCVFNFYGNNATSQASGAVEPLFRCVTYFSTEGSVIDQDYLISDSLN
jgi:hypothetical protein